MNKILSKFKAASPAAKSSMALLFANLILKGLSLISGPVFTRLMTTEQYGIVSTFTSWQNLLAVIITLDLSKGVFNNGMLEFKEDRDRFEFSLLSITTVLTAVFFVIFLIFKDPLTDFFELPTVLIYIMLLYFLFVPAYQFWGGRQRYEYKYKALPIITVGIAVASLVFGVVAVLFADESHDAIARVCVMEGINIAVGAFFFVYLAVKAKFKINKNYCVYALKFNIPLVPHYLSMYVLSSSDRIMITKMVNSSSTAIYSVAYTAGWVINIVWQSIEASLSPWIYEKLDSGDKNSIKKLTLNILLLIAVLCVSCTLFAPEIMAILAPTAYSSGIYVIPPVAAGTFFMAVYGLYMRIELFYKQTGFAAVASCIAAVSNIILNVIFINLFGFIAAGYTTLACYALLALFHYFNVRRKGYSDIINNKGVLCISLAVVVLSISVVLLYSFTLIRYIVIAVILVILFVKRKEVIKIIKFK